jgi:hypothetical protein
MKHAFNIAKIGLLQATTTREINLLYVVQEIHVPPSFDYGMKLYPYSLQELTKTRTRNYTYTYTYLTCSSDGRA